MPSELTRFKAGQSGNPGGRPKGIAARAREHTDRAIEVLVEGMEDDDRKVRIAAAKELLDRGFGKPIAMTADVTNRLDDWTDDDISTAIDALRATLTTAGGAGEGTDKATKH